MIIKNDSFEGVKNADRIYITTHFNAVMQKKFIDCERKVLFKLRYLIIEYYQLFVYLYTILSSVARFL